MPPGPLRLLGLQVSALEDVRSPLQGQLFGGGQASLFAHERPAPPPADQRLERAAESIDRLRTKYGAGTVVPASLLAASAPRDD